MSAGAGGILRGLRLLELSAFVAAPLGGATLAALGAEVVRVEAPGGGPDAERWPLHRGRSLYRAGLDQGKRSVTVDVNTPRGQELVRALATSAGTVLTNLPVRGWLAFDRLRSQRPDLVMLAITGNADGSAAVDYTVNAAVGFPSVTGPVEHEGPVNHVLPAWDALTGYLAAAGILAAELHRVRTGEGQLVSLSLSDVAIAVTANLGFLAEAGLGEQRPRLGNDLFGTYGRDFKTADGRSLIVVALTPRQWQSVVEATGAGGELAELERRLGLDFRREGDRYQARAEIGAIVESWVAARTLIEASAALDSARALWGPYQTFSQLLEEDPRTGPHNPMLADVEQPGIGVLRRAGSPLRFGAAERVPPAPSPDIGADTDSVLRRWLGLSDPDLEALRREGVLGQE